MVILRRGVQVTVVLLVVVVVDVVLLRGGVVVVVVVLLALDVGIGEEERCCGGGRGGVLGRGNARCQGGMALDGAVPAGGASLRGCRQEASTHRDGDEGGGV